MRSLLVRLTLCLPVVGLGAGAALAAVPAAAGAATLVTPGALTNCFGSLQNDSGGANQLDYSFACNTDITSYTVFVERSQDVENNIDNFNTGPTVVAPTPWKGAPPFDGTATTQIASCGGFTPGDGVNCYAQGIGSDGKTPVLGVISAWNITEGSITLDEPYCKSLPTGAKPGTPAIPKAVIGLIVTDNTGDEDGPFYLPLNKACPKVANKVPAKTGAIKKKAAHSRG